MARNKSNCYAGVKTRVKNYEFHLNNDFLYFKTFKKVTNSDVFLFKKKILSFWERTEN